MWKFYETQLILNISSTSAVFTLFPSVFSLASLLYMFFSFHSLLLSVVQILGGPKKTQWAHEPSTFCGREAFYTLAGTVGSGLCSLFWPHHSAAVCNPFQTSGTSFGKASSDGDVQGQWLPGKLEWQKRVVQPYKLSPANSGSSFLLRPWFSMWWEWERSF